MASLGVLGVFGGGGWLCLVSLPVTGAGVTAVDTVLCAVDLRGDFSGILLSLFYQSGLITLQMVSKFNSTYWLSKQKYPGKND